MLSVFEAAVLGAVQGLTEFIPISSSGHLVIVPALFAWPRGQGVAFEVLLHAASLLALLIYFSGDLIDLVRGVMQRDRDSVRLGSLLIIGSLPAGLAGLLLRDFFEAQYDDAAGAALQLLLTAFLLVAAEQALRRHERRRAESGTPLRTIGDMNPLDATVVGVGQAVAIIPGISRSGSTIAAALSLGIARDDAARFAFLLAIPALIGATILEAPKLGDSEISLGAGVAGFLLSLVTSYAAIAGLIKYLRSRSLYPFAAYCAIAGIAFYLILR
ncbi:MAG: undecaprenyl-diphosphate phosphatase [Actinomycetota bacterium]